MIRIRKRTRRKYLAPSAVDAPLELELNFCDSMRFNVQVHELENMNSKVDAADVDTYADPFYFEF